MGNKEITAFKMMSRDHENDANGSSELQNLDNQLGGLRQDNAQMRYQQELMNREFESMMFENNGLYSKLANLEKVFIGESITSEVNEMGDTSDSGDETTGKRYSHGLLVTENNELRARIEAVEQDKIELKGVLIKLESDKASSTGFTREDSNMDPDNMRKALKISQAKEDMENQIHLIQSRVQGLTEQLLEGYPKPSSSSSKKSNSSSYMRFKKSMNDPK